MNRADISSTLDNLDQDITHPDLDEAYGKILSAKVQGESQKRDLLRALQFVVGAQQSLTIDALTEAVVFDDHGKTQNGVDRRYVLDITNCLLNVDELDLVQFAHLSVKEYLQKLSTSVHSELSNTNVHIGIAKSCLSCVLFNPATTSVNLHGTLHKTKKQLILSSFAQYALLYWPFHARDAGESGRQEQALETLLENLFNSAALDKWQRALERIRDNDTMFIRDWALLDSFRTDWELSMESRWEGERDLDSDVFFLKDVKKQRWPDDEAWALRREWRIWPLTQPPGMDPLSITKSFQERMRRVQSRSGFLIACAHGFVEIVRRLRREHPRHQRLTNALDATGLMIASAFGNHKIIRFLLESGADVHLKDSKGHSAMWWAVTGEHGLCAAELAHWGLSDQIVTTWTEKCKELIERGNEELNTLENSNRTLSANAS